jgi:hypothetical protein
LRSALHRRECRVATGFYPAGGIGGHRGE